MILGRYLAGTEHGILGPSIRTMWGVTIVWAEPEELGSSSSNPYRGVVRGLPGQRAGITLSANFTTPMGFAIAIASGWRSVASIRLHSTEEANVMIQSETG